MQAEEYACSEIYLEICIVENPRWWPTAILDFEKCSNSATDQPIPRNFDASKAKQYTCSNGLLKICIAGYPRWRPTAILDFEKML
jgi:hypothetical protein